MRLVAVVLFLALAVGASGAADGGLVFRRSEGSQIAFPGTVRAWCDREALHVASPGTLRQSRWEFSATRRGAHPKRSIPFVWERRGAAEIFVFDARTHNEASSEAEGTRGRVTFRKVACERGSALEFRVDATIGSEFSDGKPVTVAGTFVGRVSSPPPRR